jgi:predicted nucleotidyltransferase
MAKALKKPEEIFAEFTSDFQKIFGAHLISISLYGSGAREDYAPGKSDLNFLIVLSEEGIGDLKKVHAVLPKWRKRRVAIPLIMTKSFILSSLDSYPIEFLNMKRHYVPVFGEDVLTELIFNRSSLRLQAERELKGKILLLRARYLETEGKEDRIKDLIRESITAFVSIFNALLYLMGMDIPKGRSEVVRAVSGTFSVTPRPF